jgi:hypothetical protein
MKADQRFIRIYFNDISEGKSPTSISGSYMLQQRENFSESLNLLLKSLTLAKTPEGNVIKLVFK